MKKLGYILGGRGGAMIGCGVELVIGVLLLIDPEGFTTGVVVALGAVLAAMGAWNMIRYFRRPVHLYGDWLLGRGVLLSAGGVFCMVNSRWVLGVLPALFSIYGVLMLVAGAVKLQHAVDLKRMGHSRWYAAGIAALAYMAVALVILLNPFDATMMVWQFIGISMMVSAALDMASLILAG